MVGDYNLVLNYNEARFEKLLREGKSQDITSQLIASVMKTLTIQPEFNIKDKIDEIRNKLAEKTNEFNKILNEVKELQNLKEYIPKSIEIDTRFSYKLQHKEL